MLGHLGDLLLSSIKRDVGIKDTGAAIPGHGGLLAITEMIAAAQASGEIMVPTEPRKLARQLMMRVDLILDGARKRNERVAAPGGTSRRR